MNNGVVDRSMQIVRDKMMIEMHVYGRRRPDHLLLSKILNLVSLSTTMQGMWPSQNIIWVSRASVLCCSKMMPLAPPAMPPSAALANPADGSMHTTIFPVMFSDSSCSFSQLMQCRGVMMRLSYYIFN